MTAAVAGPDDVSGQPGQPRPAPVLDRSQAQARVDRILAFRQELAQLQAEGVVPWPDAVTRSIDNHHRALLAHWQDEHQIDAGPATRQLSWGMRIASLCGGVALSAALYFFLLQVWAGLATAAKVVVLVAAPVLAVLAAAFAARRERSLYFTSLLALVAVAAFVLGVWWLAGLFNRTPSPTAFLVWALFAGLLAYAWGLRLILAVALAFLALWLAALAGAWGGYDWSAFGDTPEAFLFAGLVLALAGGWHPPRPAGFASLWCGLGLALVLAVALLLSCWGEASRLPLAPARIEQAWQLAGLMLSAATIWLGIRRGWPALANLGVGFLLLNLYARFFQWGWDRLPRALFFLLLAGISVAVLLVLMRMRRRHAGAP